MRPELGRSRRTLAVAAIIASRRRPPSLVSRLAGIAKRDQTPGFAASTGPLLLAAASVCPRRRRRDGEPRRVVVRAEGKWRGSTVGGYLYEGDEQTIRENFRLPCAASLDKLVELVAATGEMGSAGRTQERSGTARLAAKQDRLERARLKMDRPTIRFKVAVCLYAMGAGGPLKPLGDAASIGKSTLRKWLSEFASSRRLFF